MKISEQLKKLDLLEEVLEIISDAVDEFEIMGVRIGVPMSHAQHQFLATREASLILEAAPFFEAVRIEAAHQAEMAEQRRRAAEDMIYQDDRFGQ